MATMWSSVPEVWSRRISPIMSSLLVHRQDRSGQSPRPTARKRGSCPRIWSIFPIISASSGKMSKIPAQTVLIANRDFAKGRRRAWGSRRIGNPPNKKARASNAMHALLRYHYRILLRYSLALIPSSRLNTREKWAVSTYPTASLMSPMRH